MSLSQRQEALPKAAWYCTAALQYRVFQHQVLSSGIQLGIRLNLIVGFLLFFSLSFFSITFYSFKHSFCMCGDVHVGVRE